MAAKLQPLAVIAEGAQGKVYLARDPALRRLAAVKMLRLAGDPAAAAAALLREIGPFLRAVADAPCLPVLNAGRLAEASGRLDLFAEAKDPQRSFYLELPYIHGPSLRELGLAAGALTTEEVGAVVGLLARRLAKLHAAGESHLDVKPENVLVEASSGALFLAGYHAGTKAGSPGYAAPEQATSPGPACDVYALCRLGLELWAGKLPAPGKPEPLVAPEPPREPEAGEEVRALHRTLAGLLRAGIGASGRPTAAELAEKLPGWEEAVRRIVVRAPVRRVTELQRFLEEADVAPRRAGEEDRAERRRPWTSWEIAIVFLLTIGALAWVLQPRKRTELTAPPPTAVPAPAPKGFRPSHYARELGVDEPFDPVTKGMVTIELAAPRKRLAIRLDGGPEVWAPKPPLASFYRLELLAGRHYVLHETYAGGQIEDEPLEVTPGVKLHERLRANEPSAPVGEPAEVRSRAFRLLAARGDPAQQIRIDAPLKALAEGQPLVHFRADGQLTEVDLTPPGAASLTLNANDLSCSAPGVALAAWSVTAATPVDVGPREELCAFAVPGRAAQEADLHVRGFATYATDAGPKMPRGWVPFASARADPAKQVRIEKTYDALDGGTTVLDGPFEALDLDWSGLGYLQPTSLSDGCRHGGRPHWAQRNAEDPLHFSAHDQLCVFPGGPGAGPVTVRVIGFRP